MYVNILAFGDIPRCRTDYFAVFDNMLALGNRLNRNLMSVRHVSDDLDISAAAFFVAQLHHVSILHIIDKQGGNVVLFIHD